MRNKVLLTAVAAALVCLAFLCPALHADAPADAEYRQAAAAIQISSNVSDGSYGIADIAAIANKEGFDVVAIADRDLMRWQYGLWPLRRVIKRTVEHRSVFRYGIRRYLDDVAAAQDAHPGMVVLTGLESAPFYYWREDIANRRLTIKNWHKHMLVLGLDDPDAIRRLPVTGNTAGLALPFRLTNLLYFIFPVLAFAAGVYVYTNKRFSYARFHRVMINTGNHKARTIGVAFMLLGLALLAYGYPYQDLKFDQFGGDRGIMPYQNFIDYVNGSGGMVFWVHPEAENVEHRWFGDIITPEHSEALLQSRDYTGYTVFPDGYERVGRPGGIWDRVLNEYCDGERAHPVWAIGSLAIDRTADLRQNLANTRTVLLLPPDTGTALREDRPLTVAKAAALAAIREGRMYAVEGSNAPRFVLDAFRAGDPADAAGSKTMGEELVTDAQPLIVVRAHFSDGIARPVTAKLIRNGMVIKTFTATSPLELSYQDEHSIDRERNYYRLEIASEGVLLLTNPIFIRKH